MALTMANPLPLRVLVGDDQPHILEAIRLLLKGAGYKTETVESPAALFKYAQAEAFDLILMDMNYARDTTSGQEGLDLLAQLQTIEGLPPVVVMTAWSSVDLAVEAMQRGASDFVQKPWDNSKLLATVDKQVRRGSERREAIRRARSELEIARDVQQKLFPNESTLLCSVEYAGRCMPAQEIGGDFYDFLDLAPGRLGILLGDVSGKGIAAALLMANLQALFRSHTTLALENPAELIRSVNSLFRQATKPEHFATLFFGEYKEETRCLRYVNCGHPAPVLIRQNGSVERLEANATVVGVFRELDCTIGSVQLACGDRLVLFSDGVLEAGIESDEEFGEDRLLRVLTEVKASAQLTIQSVVDAVLAHSPHHQSDDLTLVVLHCA